MSNLSVTMPAYRGIEGNYHILVEDFHIEGVLDDGRVFEATIKAGFIFDGASVPRALWRVCGHPMSVPRVVAALVHDWLYSAHVCEREDADEVYYTLCRMVGINWFDSQVQFWTLRACGWCAWGGHDAKDEDFARSHGEFILEGEVLCG